MSQEQFPQDQDAPKPEQAIPSQSDQQTPFQPQNGSFPPNNGGFGNGMQQALPNATIVLVLGILSILTCCCYGIIGLVLAIIAMVLSKKDKELFAANAGLYTESSSKNLNAGRICAIIGLVLNGIYLVITIIIIAIYGFAGMNQDAMREIFQNMR